MKEGIIIKTLLVNFYAAPGSGKSTTMAGVFAELKLRGINAEMASEFAKDLVWEERHKTFEDQIYILGKQYHRISRLNGKVDVILTDSPLLFSIFYKSKKLSKNLDNLVMELHHSFNNMNFFINRCKPYNPLGRNQTEDEAKIISGEIYNMLEANNVFCTSINGDKDGINIATDDILTRLSRLK